ncbi:hypothetical protein IX39_06820 [Chryseobacterium formosense]|uniref:DegT/DnrJ/EryC1/StrS aminotransferase family protein n=1 Tax=Chryseobacterium formosense TaxID=236814 RepID=A0A085Z7E8_9FLAO|nr:hypothetical protein [Chryseobacterium formosense]KFF00362.1 hypothetical protein IX39_06820 [Chryseobacterium formosense]SFT33226.1 hypothetical protein SAMN05421857_0071 [Chryseobacterium formosense]
MLSREFGSDFFYTNQFPLSHDALYLQDYIKHDYCLHYSGRTALYAVLEHGIKNLGWKNVYIPEYFCHEVINYQKQLPINIIMYKDGPYVENFNVDAFDELDQTENVIFIVNYFGVQIPKKLSLKNAHVIEDHTHSLTSDWVKTSDAHFCIASLRKSMPIPTGGIYWSPKGLALPEKNTGNKDFISASFFMKLSGMFLKSDYMKGENVEKSDFRKLYLDSESMFGDLHTQGELPEFGEKLIHSIPLSKINRIKRENYKILQAKLSKKFNLLNVLTDTTETPLGFILVMNNKEERDDFKSYLIEKSIYPAVLWPNQVEKDAIDFSEKFIFLHCDFRYSEEDIEYLSTILNSYYSN